MTGNAAEEPPGLGVGQPLHFGCLALLLALTWWVWGRLGSPFPVAFWNAVAVPVAHQVFVWLTWRLELRSSAISKTLGFRGYLFFFFLLFGCRFVTALILAWMDRGSLGLPALLRTALTALCILLGAYTMYSVQRYFGMARAAGADHFDPRYRELPLVRKGVFRFTNNAMYHFGFLLFWAIAVGFDSSATVLVAVFSHAYIWVHFHTTEKADMDYLHSS